MKTSLCEYIPHSDMSSNFKSIKSAMVRHCSLRPEILIMEKNFTAIKCFFLFALYQLLKAREHQFFTA